jgi:ribosomal protein L11 methyltransferase
VRPSGAWVSIRVHPGSNRDAVLAALFESGAQGVQELGDNLVTHVQGEPTAEAVICAILAASPDARVDSVPLVEIDWAEQWKRSVRVQTIGDLIIAPPWLADEFDPARTVIIEPAMAFGTGEHATTRGMLRLMQGIVRSGDRVADLGAGSAVLSIAAAKLGARYVAAIEIDADAIGNAEENVRRSGAEGQVVVIEGDAATLLPLVGPVRVVLGNIISCALIDLLPAMAAALDADGHAILGGILTGERQEMVDALAHGGWRIENEDTEDGWWSTTIARR